MTSIIRLENKHTSAMVQPLGAMVSSAEFRIGEERSVQPFFSAPWKRGGERRNAGLPPILRELGAEWPCVPFGGPGSRQDLPEDWKSTHRAIDWDGNVHGHSSNNDWELTKISDEELRAVILYPSSSPIDKLVREIRLDQDAPTMHFTLNVHARSAAELPIGLHPVFDLAGLAPETAFLEIPDSAKAWTFPVDVEPGRGRFIADQRAVSPMRVQTALGPADIRALPFKTLTEDLVLLTELTGEIALAVPPRGFRAKVVWDQAQLQNCLLWFSNGGRDEHPWNGVTWAIGIEPVAAAFDLGLVQSLSRQTPLAKRVVQTFVSLSPERPWSIGYSIEVSGLS